MSQKKYPITLFLTIWLGIFVCPLCLPAWRDINSFYMITNVSIFHNSTNNSNGILTSGSNEMGLSTVFSYNGSGITFKTNNGITYVNATEMAKPFKKRPNDYLSLSSANELIRAITRKYGNADFQPVTIIRGTVNPGTWMCEDLALDFAQWLSVDFRLWCLDRIKELLTTGKSIIPNFNDPAEAAEAWAKEYREKRRMESLMLEEKARADQEEREKITAVKTLESKQRDIDFSETFEKVGENDMLIREVAKKLEQNGVITAEKSLREFLIAIHFFTQDSGRGKWELTARMVEAGYARYRSYYIDTYSGDEIHTQTVYVTGKGYRWILSYILGRGRKLFLSMKGNRIKAS